MDEKRHSMGPRPFWESDYCGPQSGSVFGEVSREIVELAPMLPSDAHVLDLGCGDGRIAVYLAERGFKVTGVDVSTSGIRRLGQRADEAGVSIETVVADIATFAITRPYELIIAHGVLHLLDRADHNAVVGRMKDATCAGGYNVVAAFTDALPPPPDLAPFMTGTFRRGELFQLYSDWSAMLAISYVLDDEHPGGIRHRHSIDKIVAKRN